MGVYDLKPEVTSCEIADGINSMVCNFCNKMGASYPPPREDKPMGPEYCHILADGVTLSDKAKYRLIYAVPALTEYNCKNRTDYKLVDALPQCTERISDTLTVLHCNFIAKKNGDSNKLFFAEIDRSKSEGPLVVTYCRIVSGKTKTGCQICSPVMGKRVIHPMRGYRFGVNPNPKLRLTGPRLRSSSSRTVEVLPSSLSPPRP